MVENAFYPIEEMWRSRVLIDQFDKVSTILLLFKGIFAWFFLDVLWIVFACFAAA
tara:strand:- start:1297 stop:1461 length:165 start_codon:yes stop_codon:yes gene_type:complete